MIDKRLEEAIESCRPGSQDQELPEHAPLGAIVTGSTPSLDSRPENGGTAEGTHALSSTQIEDVRRAFAKAQQLDAHLTEAFAYVPVPAGLADRILSQLASVTVECSTASTFPTQAEEDKNLVGRGRTRRWVLGSLAAGVAIAASGLFLVLSQQSRTSPVELSDEAVAWYQQMPAAWLPMEQVPAGFDVPSSILAVPRGWQPLAKQIGKRGIAFDLTSPNGPPAALFVLSGTRSGLVDAPPALPQSTTAGLAISVWQSGGKTYVLVVRGGERSYRRLIHAIQPSLA